MGVISVPKSPSPRVPVPCPHDPKGAEQNSAQKNSVPIWKGVRELENNSVTFCSLPCHALRDLGSACAKFKHLRQGTSKA